MTGKYSHRAQPELYIKQFLLSETIIFTNAEGILQSAYINSGITLTIQETRQLREYRRREIIAAEQI